MGVNHRRAGCVMADGGGRPHVINRRRLNARNRSSVIGRWFNAVTTSRVRGLFVSVSKLVLGMFAISSVALAQPDIKPTNDLPNPYKTVEGWAKMPEGRTWGSTSAVAIDRDGQSIWVAERCGANNCVGSTLDPVLHFDKNGKLIKSFGAGMILSPHGLHVDQRWTTSGSWIARAPSAEAAAVAAVVQRHRRPRRPTPLRRAGQGAPDLQVLSGW